MAIYITSLPVTNHQHESTAEAIYRVMATLRAAGITYNVTPGAVGFWYEGADLYRDDTVLLEMSGDPAVMRRALARFGEDAEQYEVLFVERTAGLVVGRGFGAEDAARLAKEHGGATLMPGGVAVSFKYASLVHGRDYVSTVTGATR